MRFLILGCQRSGTTMLAAALSRHPNIAVYDEKLAYRALMRYPSVASLSAPVIGYKIPRWTDLLPGPIHGERDQRLEGEWTYDHEPGVFVVREPTAVVSSMEALTVRDKSWLTRYGVPLVRQRMAAQPDLLERFGWVEGLPPAERRWALGAVYWVAKNESLLPYVAAGYPMFPVRYETLARRSTAWRDIAAFLDVEWDSVVFESGSGSLAGLNSNELAAGGTDPLRPVDAASLSDRSAMSADAQDLIRSISAETEAQLSSLLHD